MYKWGILLYKMYSGHPLQENTNAKQLKHCETWQPHWFVVCLLLIYSTLIKMR